MASDFKGNHITTIPKKPGEEIRVTVDEFNGRIRVNVRTFWQDDFGDWKPGKQGIALTPDQLRALMPALVMADEALKAEGL